MITTKKIIAYALKHPETFIGLISLKYPFNKQQLDCYKSILDWDKISSNTHISWTKDILSKYKHELNWSSLSANTSAFQDFDLIIDFQDLIHWKGSKYAANDSISDNNGVNWNIDRLRKYAYKLNFEKLSASTNIDWNSETIELFRYQWNWEELLANNSFPWTTALFEKYSNESDLRLTGARNNNRLLNYDFVEKYGDFLDWHSICMNPTLPWSEKDLLHKWSDKLIWTGIAANPYFYQNDSNFFQKHFDIWLRNKALFFTYFSSNEGFDWNVARMDFFKENIDWDLLSANEGVAWNEQLIDRFSDVVFWGGWVPLINMASDGSTMRQKNKYMYESGLINNQTIKWTVDMLEKYDQSIDARALVGQSSVWEKSFAPYINSQTLDIILRIM